MALNTVDKLNVLGVITFARLTLLKSMLKADSQRRKYLTQNWTALHKNISTGKAYTSPV